MKKILAYVLPLAVSLAAIGLSLNSHATATPVAKQQQVAAVEKADDDLVGVLGDVLIDGCNAGDAHCGKAWKDLGGLAGKDSL